MTSSKKKKYSKPELLYESFELSQSIAGDCEGIANFAQSLCSVTVTFGGSLKLTIFQSASIGCKYTAPNGDDMVCYHAPSEPNNVFSS